VARWTLQDVDWAAFDRDAVDPGLLKLAKAAAVVERNGADYATYLCNVFHDDVEFQRAARDWAAEEERHGEALGRWAEMVDPEFRLAEVFRRFVDGYRIPVDAAASVRGSRTGELVARCVVEIGTSSFYASLQRASREPVLREICRRIAGDELRHFKLFYDHQKRYRAAEGVGRWRRLSVALGRIAESGDDELAFAWHCANEADRPYVRRRCTAAYAAHAYPHYRPELIERATAMAFKATGFDPQGRAARIVARLAWGLVKARAAA
jgi:rubrerythrin